MPTLTTYWRALWRRSGFICCSGIRVLRQRVAGVVRMISLNRDVQTDRLFTCTDTTTGVHTGKKTALPALAFIITTLLAGTATAVPPGTLISNTATANFDDNGSAETRLSNTVDITTTLALTPTEIRFFQYSPTGQGASAVLSSPSGCSLGSPAGPFPPLANPGYPGIGTLDTSLPVDLVAASHFHQGEPVFIEVRDGNRNIDRNSRDSVEVSLQVAATGDQEQLLLSETSNDSGVFVGYIPSAAPAATQHDCQLAIDEESVIRASYTDFYDNNDGASSAVLVDPFGIIFDSVTGDPVDGTSVTILDAGTGLPAQVFGDDGISVFPSTVTSGGTATDSSGAQYDFPPGGYRFPFMAPGNYRIVVTAATFISPSTKSINSLQQLPGAPFALDAQASFGEDFVLNAGPPLNVDIPIDPVSSELFITKSASRNQAAIGDFVQYTLELTNNQTIVTANNTRIVDVLPAGFRYQPGSTRQDGSTIADPVVAADGRSLTFTSGDLTPGASIRISYVLEVTAGTQLGDAINKASATDSSGTASNIATALVTIEDDLINSRSFIMGRVMLGNCTENTPAEGTLQLRMNSSAEGNSIAQTITVASQNLTGQQPGLFVEIPAMLRLEPGSLLINGQAAADPQAGSGLIWIDLFNNSVADQYTIKYRLVSQSTAAGTFTLRARAVARSQDGNIQSTPYVSNTFERDRDDRNITFTLDDSGDKTITLDNLQQYNHEPSVGTDLEGVAGVRLMLEDGRYVISDDKGLYHFEGLHPGTHVVAIDPGSLPAHLEVFECEQNTRFAGDAYSQFADLQGGLIWRSDFYVRERAPLRGGISTRLQSNIDDDTINYTLTISGNTHHFENIRTNIMLAEGLEFIPGSARLDQKTIEDPTVKANMLSFRLDDRNEDQWQQQLRFATSASLVKEGELSTQAIVAFNAAGKNNLRSQPAINSVQFRASRASKPVYQYQVHFDSLSSTLKPEASRQLDEFLDEVSASGLGTVTVINRADITGHADDLPIAADSHSPYKDNQSLSLARATHIARSVRERTGISEDQLIISGKGDTQPVDTSNTNAGRALNRRADLVILINDQQADKAITTGLDDSGLQSMTISQSHTTVDTQAVADPENTDDASVTVYDKAWLDAAEPGLAWLTPSADSIPDIPSIEIAIKHDASSRLELTLNGEPVAAINFEGVLRSTDKSRSIARWRGVSLNEGDNRFVVTARNQAGDVVETLTQNIHHSGLPVRAEIIKDYSQLQADGRTPVAVAVKFYDRWDKPVRKGVIGKFRLNPPYIAMQTVDALRQQPLSGPAQGDTTYQIGDNGVAIIGIEPTSQSGKATLVFDFNDNTNQIPSIKRLANITDSRQEELTVWLQGVAREWVLVGLAEGTAGYNNISGNQEALSDSDQEADYYNDGRLAFYAKGRIKGEWLMTMAYDSDNQSDQLDDESSLFQTINPDKYYTLYGDATEQYFDAPSSEPLYVRLERSQFYAMFGDFNTELTVTELSRYSRSMTGLKSEYEGDLFGMNAFAAESDQLFVRDEIQGNGTSGLYFLSEQKIVINSDKITLETRDRFQSQIILESRELTRFIDYNIDTLNGTLYFKQPVPSKDSNFNPIYIVANYEVADASGNTVTGGGRGHVKLLDDTLEIGVTGIHQGGTDGNLGGADLRYNITRSTELRAEFASSENNPGTTEDSGNAWLAELYHKNGRTDARAYYRKQEQGFGLGQQNASDSGTERYGVDGRYLLTDNVYLNGEAYHDEILTTGSERDVAAANVEYRLTDYVLSSGLIYAKDRLGTGETNDSTLLTANVSRGFFDNRLKLHAGTEYALDNGESVDYPTRYILGGDYRVHPNVELFAEQEFTSGDQFDSNATRVGFRSTPWQLATVNSSVEQQSTENGLRVFSNLGLTQGYQVNEFLLVDFGIDRSQTLHDSGITPFNPDVPLSSGSIDGDFTATYIGGTYTRELWSATSRVEYRTGEQDIQRGLFVGVFRQHTPGMGMSMAAQLFDTDSDNGSSALTADIRFSLAYRPIASRWILLNRLDLNGEDNETDLLSVRNRKIVNNLNLNYLYNRRNQLAIHHGIKYARDTLDGSSYDGLTQVLGVEYRHDINARWDVGIHGNILYSGNSNVFQYSIGPSIGMNLFRNVWISAGYNYAGFEDNDFSSAGYTAAGPYAKIRFKFGTQTIKELVSWADR